MNCVNFSCVLLLAVSGEAAQVREIRRGDDRLKGIAQVDVLVRMPPMEDSACQVARPAIEQDAVAVLEAQEISAAVSARAPSWFHTVIVDVSAIDVGGRCATSVQSTLITQVDGIPDIERSNARDEWGSLLVGSLVLAHEQAMVAASRREQPAKVAAALAAQLRALGQRIRKRNP